MATDSFNLLQPKWHQVMDAGIYARPSKTRNISAPVLRLTLLSVYGVGGKPTTIQALADKVGVDKSTCTCAMKCLEKMGLVRQEVNSGKIPSSNGRYPPYSYHVDYRTLARWIETEEAATKVG